jgi:hypothetical protein
MDSLLQHGPDGHGEHPPREQLLLSVDGELSPKEAAQVQAHLEACWHCRVRTKRLEETIADIIDFDERALKGHVAAPGGWRGFDRRLRDAAAEGASRSVSSYILGWLRRFTSSAREIVLAAPLRVRIAAIVLAATAVLVVSVGRGPSVTADELLRRAAEAQDVVARSADRPVGFQKLRVRRRSPGAQEESLTVEIWRDAASARVRQAIDTGDGRRMLPAGANAAPGLLGELAGVLVSNGFDTSRPLSAVTFAAWRERLGAKQEAVSRMTLEGGAEGLALRIAPDRPAEAAQITEATLVVRARDFHPVAERLRVSGPEGEREYELVETDAAVTTLAAVPREVFDDSAAAFDERAPAPSAAPPKAATGESVGGGAGAEASRPVATADLELDVLRLLHDVGADTGEQVSVVRTPNGPLSVTAVVDTEARKLVLVGALRPVAGNRAVVIRIETAAEADRRMSDQRSGPVRVEQVAPSGGRMPAEPDLRRYLAAQGIPAARMDAEVSRFAIRASAHARQALQHAWALKRLLARFSPEQARALDADARATWLGLVRSHAAAVERENAALFDELRPVYGSDTASGVGATADLVAGEDAVRAADRLVELCSVNDAALRAAFTASSDGSAASTVRAPQFWRSLASARALAVRIQKEAG